MKDNKKLIMDIVSKFDTNYYIKNQKREKMIQDVEDLVNNTVAEYKSEIGSKQIDISNLNQQLFEAKYKIAEYKNESLWDFIVRSFKS
jgi:hypothetical protein